MSSRRWPRPPNGRRPADPFAAEVSRLCRLLARAGEPALDELGPGDLRTLLVELLAAFPVYRAYVVPGEPAPPAAVALVAQAAASARQRLPGRLHRGLAAVCDLVLGHGTGGSGQHNLIVAFQQTCGPVMAKGVEDTAFYRWTRLVALNEVGGDPDRFGVTPERFHGFAGHLARHWPATMTTLSTHDTKRGEDVRARLAVLSESPQAWRAQLERWHARAVWLSGGRSPEPHIEYLLWQTLVGAWPIDGDRLAAYLRKAMREAKTLTSWTEPDTGYESLVLGFAENGAARQRAHRVDHRLRGRAGRGRAGELARRETRPAHHARGRPTPTRAASWAPSRWWTRTTGGRSTSPAAGSCSPRCAPARRRRLGPADAAASTRTSCW